MRDLASLACIARELLPVWSVFRGEGEKAVEVKKGVYFRAHG